MKRNRHLAPKRNESVPECCNHAATTYNYMVATAALEHISYKFCGNRRSTFVLLVLSRVGKQRKHGRNALCARNLARVDHYAKLHQGSVDLAKARVNDIDIVFTHRLCNAHRGLAYSISSNFGFGYGQPKSALSRVED